MDALTRRAALQQVMLAGAGLALVPEYAWPFEERREGVPGDGTWQLDASRALVPFEDIPDTFATKRTGDFKLPGQDALGIDLRTTAWKTPVNDTFLVAHYNTPVLDAARWQLTVNGNAGRSLQLSLDELKRRSRAERTVTFECGGNRDGVMNRMVSTCTWAGASVKDILNDARPADDVVEVVFWGADQGEETIRTGKYQMNFARSIPIDDPVLSDAILAYEVEGQPLPVVHGFPVRLIVPGWYGVANVKWLNRIELSPRRFMGRFMGRDYVTIMGRQVGDRTEWTETSVTRILVKSMVARVTRPTGGAGPMTVAGVAFTDGTPLERVEVQADGGAWRPARLEPQAIRSPHAWTFWSLDVDPLPAGSHTIASRATDRRGRTQPADLAMKKSNWENNAIWTRKIRV